MSTSKRQKSAADGGNTREEAGQPPSAASSVRASFENLYCSDVGETSTEFTLKGFGASVSIPKELLMKYSFFQNLFINEPNLTCFQTEATQMVLTDFHSYLKKEILMDAWINIYPQVRFGLKLGLEGFVKWCVLQATCVDIPRDASDDEVLDVITTIARVHPLRTAQDYLPLVDSVKKWVGTDVEKRQSTLKAIVKSIEEKEHDTFVFPGVPLFQPKLTLALMEMKQASPLKFAVYLDRKWIEIDPVGSRFTSFNEVKNFYLVPNTYIIYRNLEDCVYMKDLRNDSPENLLLVNCTLFRAIFGALRVVTRAEDGLTVVFRWNDFDIKFDEVFTHKDVIIRNVSAHIESRVYVTNILTDKDENIFVDNNNAIREIRKAPLDDYISRTWLKPRGLDNYLKYVTNMYDTPETKRWRFCDEFFCGKSLTHMGFENLAVEPLSERLGFFQTRNADRKVSEGHGRIVSISDLYLCNPAFFN